MANPVDIKQKVFALLKEALPEFGVTWGFTKKNPPRKWCYMGDTTWPNSEWATNRSRQHTMSIPVVLNAILTRTTPEEGEQFLKDSFDSLESAFGADSTLRDLGVITWGLAPRMSGTQPHTDGLEAQGVYELQVTYRP